MVPGATRQRDRIQAQENELCPISTTLNHSGLLTRMPDSTTSWLPPAAGPLTLRMTQPYANRSFGTVVYSQTENHVSAGVNKDLSVCNRQRDYDNDQSRTT